MTQLTKLFPIFDKLHKIHGSKTYSPIYGAGQINSPRICLVFMNPTAKNVSANLGWNGIKAPWLGTKRVWKMLYDLKLFKNDEMISEILRMKPHEWDEDFSEKLYNEIASEEIYITNIAKCTQNDARALPDSLFREYLPSMLEELRLIKPKVIITLGNQVSSILLQKPISVSKYLNDEFENLRISNKEYRVYPTYYPVGQGARNLALAIKRINSVLNNS